MTGFGQASATRDSATYSLEVKSLNGKFFKSVIKLPEALGSHEPRLEQLLRERLIRGSVVYVLRLRDVSENAAWDVNTGAIQGYIQALQGAMKLAGAQSSVRIDLAGLLALPGVCQMPELDPEEMEKTWELLKGLTDQALDQLQAMRLEEGRSIQADLLSHCARIRENLQVIRSRAPVVVRDYAERLRNRVRNLLSEVEIQLREEDLAREVAIFAERADINEETSRLDSHLLQFQNVMDKEANAGRKLEFLAQEMLRETNTIGSKANDAEIAQHVVAIKGHIDRIKEQVMNVV